MSARRHVSTTQFHKVPHFKRLTKKQKGHTTEPSFSHRKQLVGFRPESKLGAQHEHAPIKEPKTKMRKPGTYVLHAPKPRVRRKH